MTMMRSSTSDGGRPRPQIRTAAQQRPRSERAAPLRRAGLVCSELVGLGRRDRRFGFPVPDRLPLGICSGFAVRSGFLQACVGK
ncbi:hypothetical protein NL676_026424 [Syzygium grande]|nr:hypothetical protein NL676_026424 [Syzygium grande]